MTARTYPIGPFQTRVLEAITTAPGVNIRAVAIDLGTSAGNVSHAVLRLERRGLVTSQKGRTVTGWPGRLCYPVPA
ncbi:MarR family transcriptional regulator (plasmid) [Deinococcus radiomollis]|uniref:MarR family transcriptional regulator n=1 Tax=Deinococcus radiomollis TaxID=468916 RepID=UPI00389159A0